MKKILAVLAVSCTVMLFAACQDKTYDVTFMVDGAQYGETLTVKEGETVTLPAAPQKEGYRFIDWYEADAEEAFDDASAVSRDYTLSAKFEENVYTLSFDGGDAEGEMSSVELTYTQEYTLPACTYEWTDHAFVGWALDADGEMTYADGAKVSKLTAEHEAEVTLYAVWSEQYYTVSFDGGDGLGSMQSVKVPMSGKVSLPANAFVKEGWHFAGWATQENGEAVYTDGAEISALTQTVGGSVTLYAVWEEDYYLVRYNANGGEGTMAEQKVKLSETAALTANAFSKEGYTFVGWATSADGEAVYDDAEQVTALASQNGAVIELYAVWRGAPETYTVVTKIQQADGSFTETSEQKRVIPIEQFAALYGTSVVDNVPYARGEFNINCSLGDVSVSPVGRFMNGLITFGVSLIAGSATNREMMVHSAIDMPLRGFMGFTGGLLSMQCVEGLLDMCNGTKGGFKKFVKGFKKDPELESYILDVKKK